MRATEHKLNLNNAHSERGNKKRAANDAEAHDFIMRNAAKICEI
jgi:hypothetical protein